MKTEEKLKTHILTKYKSIRDFCQTHGFAYSTIDNIFKRDKGIMGVSVSLMINICNCLCIDLEALMNGEIKEKPNTHGTSPPEEDEKEKTLDIDIESLSPAKQEIIRTVQSLPDEKASLLLRLIEAILSDNGEQ